MMNAVVTALGKTAQQIGGLSGQLFPLCVKLLASLFAALKKAHFHALAAAALFRLPSLSCQELLKELPLGKLGCILRSKIRFRLAGLPAYCTQQDSRGRVLELAAQVVHVSESSCVLPPRVNERKSRRTGRRPGLSLDYLGPERREVSREIHEEDLGTSEIGRNSKAFPKPLSSQTLLSKGQWESPHFP
jgi:hypothetical protein